jgi:diguanylate cyclase (GGDEF)-like protein
MVIKDWRAGRFKGDENNMLLSKQVSTNTHQFPIYWLILGLALLALGGAIGYSITHEYNRIDVLERERLATQTKTVDANLEHQLVALNSALMSIRDDLPYFKAQKDSKALINRLLQAMSDAIPGIRTIAITDAKGTISTSNQKQLIGLNFHEREYFRVPRQGLNQAMLYISPPFKSVLGVYIMNVTMVVLDTRGAFAGIVTASLDPDFFSFLLNSVLYAPGMRASLIHGDGKIFVEVPDRKDLSGMDLAKPGSRYTLHVKSGRAANLFATGRAYSTGDERMSAWRTIRPASLLMDKPLMITVNRDMRGIFAPWRRGAFIQGGLFGVLSLAAVFGLYFYQRRQQKYDCLAASYTAELQKSEQRYRELSIVDDLTQLSNSRYFYVQLKSETERSNRHGHPLTLLLLDLDNFKAFNDSYGHVEGDQVLSRLGLVIKRCLRETDSAYRYGGEEFTILLPMTRGGEGVVTAERIRTEFQKETFSPAPGQEAHMTVSVGLAQYKTKEEMKAFVHRVDQLMYHGKKNGKDRVCCEP